MIGRASSLERPSHGSGVPRISPRPKSGTEIKPGITGWAQVNGWRGETDTVEKIQKRVEFDLYYIDNGSIWFDIQILLKTFFVILNDDKTY